MPAVYQDGLSNTAVVDSVGGSDIRGRVGGYPYRTVAAAIAAVSNGQVILLMPGVHTVAAGITSASRAFPG